MGTPEALVGEAKERGRADRFAASLNEHLDVLKGLCLSALTEEQRHMLLDEGVFPTDMDNLLPEDAGADLQRQDT